MKKLVLPAICTFIVSIHAMSQDKPGESFYVMDEHFKGTTLERAVYLVHALKKSDTCWQFDTYHFSGPMISSEQYKDEKGSMGHGSFIYFNKKGEVDSSGTFINGWQDGDWYFKNDKGLHYLTKTYKNGELIATKDPIKIDLIEKAKKDSADKHVTRIEVESDFKGGVNGWIKYLTENMQYPDRAQNLGKQGTAVVQFIVDKEGHVQSAEIVKSVEFSIDQEALRLIEQSPAWTPATQDGKKVKSYKKQPITFRLK